VEREGNINQEISNNKESILNQYSDLFEEYDIKNAPLYLEKETTLQTGLHRIVLTEISPFVISSKDKKNIWDLNLNNTDDLMIILEAERFAFDRRNSSDIRYQMKNIFSQGKEYNIRILPYNDSHSSEVLNYLLKRKMAIYKNKQVIHYPKSSFLLNPKRYTTVSTPEQIIHEYGKLFNKVTTNDKSLYYELTNLNDIHNEEERFICTEHNTYTISSKNGDIWNLEIKNKEIAHKLFSQLDPLKMQDTKLENEKQNNIRINDLDICLKYISPSLTNSEYILNTLERRRSYLLQK
jgi:hypothetical protein